MGLFESILLIILGVLLLLSFYLLFIPVTIQLTVLINEKITASSSVRAFPFKRLLYPRTPKPGKTPKPPKKKKEKSEEESQLGRKKRFDFSVLNRSDIGMLLGMAGEVLKLLGRLLKSPDYFLVADLAGGTEEPDITGQLYGAYHAIRPNLPTAIRISYAPDYLAGRINGNISCGLVVTVIGLVKELVIIIYRLPKIRLFKLYRKLKVRRKHGK
ncbi:MAG: hypothetical protein A2W25_12490 [candidate division Zixibacteria bacterium RBG_16_53_22]|nr:MAG: hypothetical protein A2W25_12490 [candidate division Zixibacteria bacterium RBG_16_53_22]